MINDRSGSEVQRPDCKNSGELPLLSCPFCGQEAKVQGVMFGDSSVEYYRAECADGHALDCWDDTETEAVSTWNERAR